MLLVDPISFYYWLLKVGPFWNGSPSRGSLDHRKTLRMWAIRWDILFSVNTTLEKHHDLVSGRVRPCCNVPIDLRMQYLLKKECDLSSVFPRQREPSLKIVRCQT